MGYSILHSRYLYVYPRLSAELRLVCAESNCSDDPAYMVATLDGEAREAIVFDFKSETGNVWLFPLYILSEQQSIIDDSSPCNR